MINFETGDLIGENWEIKLEKTERLASGIGGAGDEPVKFLVVNRNHPSSFSITEELQDFILELVAVVEKSESPNGGATGVDSRREAQPLRHHRVNAIAANEHLGFDNGTVV